MATRFESRTTRRAAWVARGIVGLTAAALLMLAALDHARAQNSPTANVDLETYRLVNARAADVVPQLRTMLDDYGARADVLVDRTQNRVIVRGPETTRQLAAQLIQTLDKKAPDSVVPTTTELRGTVKGYHVAADQLDTVSQELRRRFPTSMGVRIAPDSRTSQLVVIAPDTVHSQIAAYLKSLPPQETAERQWEPRRVPEVKPAEYRLKYQLKNITWREFEASLRRLWGTALTISAEPSGQVALVRSAVDPAGSPVMRIDRAANEVTFSSGRNTDQSWRQIAAALDRAPTGQSRTTQLVPLKRADPNKVREAVTMIRDAALRTSPGDAMAAVPVAQPQSPRNPSHLVSMLFQPANQPPAGQQPATAQPGAAIQPGVPAQPGAGAQPAQPRAGAQPGQPAGAPGAEVPPEEEVGMLGDVQIEFVPELGVIILRGNRGDVDRVKKIIDEIERTSSETQPNVEVVSLAHSNSEALGELVTQIYQDVYEPRQGSLSITALVKPNAILLVGREENIDTAKELIGKLDRPVAPDTQIKVFHLLNMSAVDAQQYIQSFYGTAGATTTGAAATQQQGPRGLSPRVNVIADFRSNSLIVQASPRDLAEVADLLRQLDVEKTEATVELRVFPLKNSMASEMATVLQNALAVQAQGAAAPGQAAANQQTQGQISKSVQIVGIDRKGNKIIESGLLTDVNIAADDNANSLIVKAPSHSMGLIAALVEQLDQVPAAESSIKVFQIQNGDATNLATMLQTLFGQQVTTGQIGAFSQTVGRTFGTQPVLQQQSAGESSLIPLSFGVDARTNSIIVSGSRGDLTVVEAILLRLDEEDMRKRELIVYRLNNAPAQFVSDALTAILQQQQVLLQQQQSQQFSLISQFEFIDQQVFVVPEIISNTLIVSATPKYYDQITKVIEDLDRRPPMIMIQVVVCLVRLDDAEEVGVELGLQDSLLFDRSTVTDGLINPGFNFVNQALGNADTAASRATRQNLGGQAFGSFNVGRTSASEGFPGMVLSAGNESVNILIRAMIKKSRAQLLSRPQIMTMNNVPASVLVGQRVPQITDFQVTNQGTVNSVTLNETGISLGVIPRVTPDGLIIMDVEARDSKVGDPADGIPIGVQDGVVINSPIFDDITAITTIAARSGQTVVFGGMIGEDRTDTFRGVPYLSEIPVVGRLFRFDTQSNARTELIFFMTPHIVVTSEELDAVNQAEAQRMSWCLADIIEAHGDPGFRPGRPDTWSQSTPVIFPDSDPTGQHAVFPQGTEPIPTPPGNVPTGPMPPPDPRSQLGPGEQPGSTPFILPPNQRTPGKPFINPPNSTLRSPRQSQLPYSGIPIKLERAPQSAAPDGSQPTYGPNGSAAGIVPAQYQAPYGAQPPPPAYGAPGNRSSG